mmetsp:Transcript_27842/g.78753  ORF Transcript_27842/g.78753 Transcript_27842/m.78753 type:complete len:223 (+) Transcript_27842:922-1590(+)
MLSYRLVLTSWLLKPAPRAEEEEKPAGWMVAGERQRPPVEKREEGRGPLPGAAREAASCLEGRGRLGMSSASKTVTSLSRASRCESEGAAAAAAASSRTTSTTASTLPLRHMMEAVAGKKGARRTPWEPAMSSSRVASELSRRPYVEAESRSMQMSARAEGSLNWRSRQACRGARARQTPTQRAMTRQRSTCRLPGDSRSSWMNSIQQPASRSSASAARAAM